MIKAFLSRARYYPAVSKTLVFLLTPVYRFCRWLQTQIAKKVKVNGVTLRYDSLTITFPVNVGVGFSSAIHWRGESGFEQHTWKVIKAASRQADFFLDIGSNFGFYSVLTQKVNPALQTICFEPFPRIYNDNLAFHQANGMEAIRIHNKAVSNVDGHTVLFVPDSDFLGDVRSASLEQDFFYNRNKKLSQHQVETITLDSLGKIHPEFSVAKVLVKIDVEGHERAVFEGANHFISSIRPVLVCEVDIHPENMDFLEGYLRAQQYQCFGISPTGLIALPASDLGALRWGRDFLFLPNEVQIPRAFLSWKDLENIVLWKQSQRSQQAAV